MDALHRGQCSTKTFGLLLVAATALNWPGMATAGVPKERGVKIWTEPKLIGRSRPAEARPVRPLPEGDSDQPNLPGSGPVSLRSAIAGEGEWKGCPVALVGAVHEPGLYLLLPKERTLGRLLKAGGGLKG